jgi:hypothetical protein
MPLNTGQVSEDAAQPRGTFVAGMRLENGTAKHWRLIRRKKHMRLYFFVLLLPAALGGCLSFSSSTPPRTTTVIVPAQPGQVVCANGSAPPC